MKKLLSKKVYSLFLVAVLLLSSFGIVNNVSAQAAPTFLTGDIMTATNNTSGNGTWSDPVNALPGEVIEFRVVAQNQQPGTTATNVVVRANLPSARSNNPTASSTVSADNAASVSDTVVVNITNGTQQGFAYINGHARIFSNACPSGCAGPDTVTSSGISVGNLGPGESAQVLFKAHVTNFVDATPTPTPTATPTPTPAPATPTPTPQGGTQNNNNLNNNNTSTNNNANANANSNNNANSQSQSQSVSQSNSQTVNITQTIAPTPTPTPTPSTTTTSSSATTTQPKVVSTAAAPAVTELPKTGLPLLAWPLAALLPLGTKLLRGNKSESIEKSAQDLWIERQQKIIDL